MNITRFLIIDKSGQAHFPAKKYNIRTCNILGYLSEANTTFLPLPFTLSFNSDVPGSSKLELESENVFLILVITQDPG